MRLPLVAAFLLAVAVAAPGQSLGAQIETANRTNRRLMMAKDVAGLTKAMRKNVTTDFKYVEEGRTTDFAAMCAGMAMGLGRMDRMIEAGAKTLTLRERGVMATATTWHTMEGTTKGAGKESHTISFKGTSEDTYVKRGGRWKMAKMAWIEQTMSIDGKLLGSMAPKGK